MKEGGKGKKRLKKREEEKRKFIYLVIHQDILKGKIHLLNGNKHDATGSLGKECSCNAGDTGLNAGLGGEHGNQLQCSCLENTMERRAWWLMKNWT